jgi:hypothetical protein
VMSNADGDMAAAEIKPSGRSLIRTHRDMEIYQAAFNTAMEVFHATRSFPRSRRATSTDVTSASFARLSG